MPVKPIPEGYPTVIPYLMVQEGQKFIGFMETVFGARLIEQFLQPDGRIGHSELRIGDSVIMLSEVAEAQQATPVMLHFYVEDVDAVFRSAIAAGAEVIAEPAQHFYGDRSGGCRGPGGNTIWIATHVEDVPPDELKRRAAAQYRKEESDPSPA